MRREELKQNNDLPAAGSSRSPCATVLVCGHGRCGSSLAMQMLRAGGMPTLGEFPAFEPEETGYDRNPETLMDLIHGMAAKIIDPQSDEWPSLHGVKVLWMERDRDEQAKSQAKFMRLLGGPSMTAKQIRAFSQSYGPDTARALRKLHDAGASIMRMRFESILAEPESSAEKIADHIGMRLNVAAMAACVISRHPACQPGLDIEMALLEQGATAVATPQAEQEK